MRGILGQNRQISTLYISKKLKSYRAGGKQVKKPFYNFNIINKF